MSEVQRAGRFDVVTRLAPTPPLARVARSVAAAYASVHGLTVDELDDVRLLVDEIFHALTAVGPGPITIKLAAGDGMLVEVDARSAVATTCWEDVQLLREVAAATTQHHAFEAGDGWARFRGQFARPQPP